MRTWRYNEQPKKTVTQLNPARTGGVRPPVNENSHQSPYRDNGHRQLLAQFPQRLTQRGLISSKVVTKVVTKQNILMSEDRKWCTDVTKPDVLI
jgi:hypothetical protein